jgi:hypothetical protein
MIDVSAAELEWLEQIVREMSAHGELAQQAQDGFKEEIRGWPEDSRALIAAKLRPAYQAIATRNQEFADFLFAIQNGAVSAA